MIASGTTGVESPSLIPSGDPLRALLSGERRGLWPALQRLGLHAASVPYGWATQLRNRAYDRGWKAVVRADVPVVSVGNLTVGGTGKTPCVEYLARFYRGQERRVAILSRGYGAQSGPNDEALLLEENLPDVPHLQGADRAALARIAVEELESELLVLDDGYQHRRLARDLDLVIVDATEPWGHGHLLPRGLLREHLQGLARAHVVLLSRCDQASAERRREIQGVVGRLAPSAIWVETRHRPREWLNSDGAALSPAELLGRPAVAFCGVGNPAAFQRTLEDLGMRLHEFRAFADHHAYSRADVEELRSWARRQVPGCVVVTTQKDLVKVRLSRLDDRELWALRIDLEVCAGQEALDHQLRQVLSKDRSACGHSA
jgi:tetraacyldisaccharide 4'-kinase